MPLPFFQTCRRTQSPARPAKSRRAISLLLATVAPWLAPTPGRAAPLQRNLGDDLVYYRLHALPADVPSDDAPPKHATILDLRFTKSDAQGASVLGSWMKFHGNAKYPTLVLVNASTPPELLHLVQGRDIPGLLTVGVAGGTFQPDITVDETPELERRAYEALELGTTVRALTTDNPDKPRNDEASLAPDRAADDAAADDSTTSDQAPTAGARTPPLIDAALQRAIQLYRGLKAMKSAE